MQDHNRKQILIFQIDFWGDYRRVSPFRRLLLLNEDEKSDREGFNSCIVTRVHKESESATCGHPD